MKNCFRMQIEPIFLDINLEEMELQKNAAKIEVERLAVRPPEKWIVDNQKMSVNISKISKT